MSQKLILNTGAQLVNNADGVIAAAVDIAGGYFATDSLETVPNYACVENALCYCKNDKKFYQYSHYDTINKKHIWNEAANVGVQYFSDSRKTIETLGGIKGGTSFENPISIQDLLVKLLYPFTDLELGKFSVKDSSSAAILLDHNYVIPNYPVIGEIAVEVTLNSVTDYEFTLYKSTNCIAENKLATVTTVANRDGKDYIVFDFTNIASADKTVTVTNTYYTMAYTYKSEDEDGNEKTINKKVYIGPFNLTFTDMAIATSATAKNSSGTVISPSQTYAIPNYPVINEIALEVALNSVTNYEFTLYKSKSCTEANKIATVKAITKRNGKDYIVFNLASANTAKKTVDVTNTYYTIKYTYNYNDESGQAKTKADNIYVGPFDIIFTQPTVPVVKLAGTGPNGAAFTNQSSLSYKVGQSCTISSVVAEVANLNSATTNGIEEFTITKNNAALANATAGAISNKKACTFTLSSEKLEPTHTTVSDDVTYTYKVAGKYDSRTASNTTWGNKDREVTGTATVTFEYVDATLSFSGVSSYTGVNELSKLNPLEVKNLKATIAKNSDKVNSVKLFVNGTEKETIDCTSDTNCTKTAYDTTNRTKTFNYSGSICSNTTFQAKANCISGTKTSSVITVNFYAPSCYGFIDKDFNITTTPIISYTQLKQLASLESFKEPPATVTLDSIGEKKVVYAVPNGNFTMVLDRADEDNTKLFDKVSTNIAFADGTTVPYQIWILKDPSAGDVYLKFS